MAPSSGPSQDIYRIGETEVFEVGGGPMAPFDLPAVRAFIRIFAPRRGEIVVDAESLDLRPAKSREPDPRSRRRRAGAAPRGDHAVGSRAEAPADGPPTHPRPSHDPRIDVLTLFPAMIAGPLAESIPAGSWTGLPASASTTCASGASAAPLRRRHALRRRRGDDPAAGAGRGRAGRAARPGFAGHPARPGGEVFRQARAADLAPRSHLIFVCPRYEGIDERIRSLVDLELSIGDYVVTGGELPALVVIDAVIRLLPGRHRRRRRPPRNRSTTGLLEYPQYTRPPVFRGMDVPAILTSGDHGAVARWRHEQALERTRRAPRPICWTATGPDRRPDRPAAVLYSAADAPVRVALRSHPRSHGCPDESGTAA